MKKLYIFFTLALLCHVAQAQQMVWEKHYGEQSTEISRCVPLTDGGFALLLIDGSEASVCHVDADGNLGWTQQLEDLYIVSSNNHSFLKVVPGGILAGITKGEITPGNDSAKLLLVKLSFQGNELWRKELPTGRLYNNPHDLYIRSSNEYLILASGRNTGGNTENIVLSVDSSGNINWRKVYPETSSQNRTVITYPRNIIHYRQDGYLLCGDIIEADYNPHIIKTDEQGNDLQHAKLHDTGGRDYSTVYGNYIPLADNKIAFTGFNNVTAVEQQYAFVTKADTGLQEQWTAIYSPPAGGIESSRILEMADGNILLVTQSNNEHEIILVKISSQGQLLDTTLIATAWSTSTIGLQDIFLLPDNSLIYASRSFMAKIANVGQPSDISEETSLRQLPQVSLYPNPASGQVRLQLSGTNKGGYLQLYSVMGQKVLERKFNSPQEDIWLPNLQAGIYLYKVSVEGRVLHGKLLVK